MQAVILAAGKGLRQRPLTTTRPKPLLEIGGTTILGHTLDALDGLVEEVILVIGYRGEDIIKRFGSSYKSLRITYVQQVRSLGTGGALLAAKSKLHQKFLVLNGDDFYKKEDIKKCLLKFPCVLTKRVSYPNRFGVIISQNGIIKTIIEKPVDDVGNLVNTGLYFLDQEIFLTKLKKSKRGELELPQALTEFAQQRKLFLVEADEWRPISYPWDLLGANARILAQQTSSFEEAIIENNVYLTNKEKIVIEKNALIKSGTHIEGPIWIGEKSVIGPNSYLRAGTFLGNDCHLGANVEIENSIIGEGTNLARLSRLRDSITGHHCNIGAGTVFANLRFDKKTIKVKVNGELIDTERRKFGTVLGDEVKIGINSSIMPGILVASGETIPPNSLIKDNFGKIYDEK